jgi:hypothetical protein
MKKCLFDIVKTFGFVVWNILIGWLLVAFHGYAVNPETPIPLISQHPVLLLVTLIILFIFSFASSAVLLTTPSKDV